MQDHYIRIQDKIPKMPSQKLLAVGYISQILLYIVIVIYCILSPSLFSTISLIFMLISFATSLATPYYIIKTSQSSQSIRVVAYPVQRVLWSIFFVINIGQFVFKLVFYLTGQYDNISTNMQQFLQLQSLLNMFIPLVLLPFIAGSMIVRTKTRTIQYFKHPINKLITIPIFLFLGFLLLLVEIFSVSVAGFCFFICMMVLIVQRKLDFSSFVSWVLVIAVQILCLIFIGANFLATTSLVDFYQKVAIFQFYGINGLNEFLTSAFSRGYIVCLILLFITSCLVQRIFAYNIIWVKGSKLDNFGQIKQQHIFMQQGITIDPHAGQSSSRALQPKRKSDVGMVKRYSLHQFQLPQVSKTVRNETQMHTVVGQPVMMKKTISERDSKISLEEDTKQYVKPNKSNSKLVFEYFLIGINKLVDFIYSTEFSLRFSEIISIVVIQRYNNIYSFVAVLWLALVASTERLRLIYYATLFILLPVQIGNFVIMYAYNAPQSPIQTLQNLQQFGFQKMSQDIFWLDIIIFNVYLFYLITFLLSASRDRSQPLHRKSSMVPKSNFFVLMIAFFFRYSYLLTIIAMFFLGFSKVNLINLVYVILFLVFFSSGENVLVEIKKKNNKQITNLSTFSRKFWFIIVYYTLVCIIAKYVYFLFFPDKLSQALEPTGINQQYNWSFNFSLSSVCLSNTTPLFIIFVLSQAQIMIYRSSIYLNYSFSLVSQITDIKKPRKNNFRIWLNTAAQILLQFYYQSLYYVSGIIILGCSYRWNITGLLIIIVTCIGLLKGFNKPMLAFIVFMDLAYIIINYLVLFTTYEVSQEFLGQNGIDAIDKISLFLGLLIKRNYDLAGVFIFNIVIFYFGVQSYGLKKILDEDRFDQESIVREIESQKNNQDEPEQKLPQQDTISSYQPTVLQQQLNDLQFAKNFNKNIIIGTKKLYAIVLWKKYSWWYKTCRFLSIFFTDFITIFVLVCCLAFRVSLTMFYFLLLYMLYYFILFDRVGSLMEQQQFYQRIQRQMHSFRSKQDIISERTNPRSMITGQQTTQSVYSFIVLTKQKSIQLRFLWRQRLWIATATVIFCCLILTYTAQFISSEFYTKYLDPLSNTTQNILDTLFVVGISVTNQTSFFRQVYFYYFMLIIAIIEKLLIKFTAERKQQEKLEKQPGLISRKQYKSLEDPVNFIDESYSFIQQVNTKPEFEQLIQKQGQRFSKAIDKRQQLSQQQYQDFSKQSNLLIYFDYKGTIIKINYLYGAMMALLRFYLLMMLINLYEKSNVFAFAYLFSVLFFWFRKMDFRMVRNINKISIIILLLQYLMLLLDITNRTSPLPLPDFPDSQTLSILQRYITSEKGQQWISYLVLDFNKQDGNSYIISFFISAIIVFLTQLYYTLFFWISKTSVNMIRKIYQRYEFIDQSLQRMPDQDTIFLNYENYKNWSYRFMTMSYQLLINNSYIVVSYLILILLSGIHNYISIGLVCFACIYIYLGIFTGFSEDKNIYTYTRIFFRIVQAILFLVLILITVSQIPVFEQQNSAIAYIETLANIEQIFLLFLIQIWLDLSYSDQFMQATQQYNNRVHNRENVMIKCMAYQENRDLVERMIKRYKQVMWFEVNLKSALDIIDQWHYAMYKKKVPEFQNLKISKVSPHIKSLQEQIKKSLQQRPQEDEEISQKILDFMKKNTSVTLKNSYYQLMKYIVFNNHRLINIENSSIDIWDYVLQNYEKLNQQIKQSQQQLKSLHKIIQNQEIGDRVDKIEIIKKQQYSEPTGNLNELVMGIIKTPKKIFIDIKTPKDSPSKVLLFFILSNFSYFLSFFIWIYYLVNPCLLSLPFIVYFFAFQIISDHKLTSLMLIYIFSIILLALWVQIQSIWSQGWVKYLFFQNDEGQYSFAVGYLFFVFILIFINQQIKRYQGNKFKYPHEAQSRIQGIFRILVNQDSNSSIYLWSLKVEQDIQQQKQSNPMQHYSDIIQKNPEHLTDSPMLTFFQSFHEGKTGIDLYPLIASIQIFLTIYLIFLYPFMTQNENAGIEQSFKYFQFSSSMVIGVLVHVGSIVVERRITLISHENPMKSKIKYWYTMLILALLLIFIYYLAPISRNVKGIYQPTTALIIFAFIYFFYFFLSALQIRYGYKKYKSLNSIMKRRRKLNNLILTIFTAVPFLYELKLMMDYSFTQTSLQFFDWFRLFSVYLNAYKAKMQYYTSTGVVLGDPQGFPMKIIGWLGFIAILLIIFGPMILFSGLNPIAQPNLVIGGALQLGIQIEGGNYFGLYSTSHFSIPPASYTPDQFYDQNFQQVPALQILTSTDIPQQFQLIQFQPYSDTNWGISYPNFQILTDLMKLTINQMQNNKTPTHNFSIVVKYQLQRRVTETVSSDTNFQYPFNGSLNLQQLQNLSNTFNECNTPTFLPGFYISLIRLFTIGNTYKPRPIVYINDDGVDPYLQGVYLTLYCDQVNSTYQTNNVFWALNSTNSSSQNPNVQTGNGIFLNVLCDKYQNLIAGLGFTALYTSVILVVAGFLRGQFEGNLPQIAYLMNPKPDNIIQISQAIGTLRDRKQFRQQYLMYFQLIDIIRSPDLMKYLSGSYPSLIEQADEKRRKKQYNKQLLSRKDKIQ